MTGASFMPEYKRQYISEMKRKGWYKEPAIDSVKLKKLQDSLRIINQLKAELDKKTNTPKK